MMWRWKLWFIARRVEMAWREWRSRSSVISLDLVERRLALGILPDSEFPQDHAWRAMGIDVCWPAPRAIRVRTADDPGFSFVSREATPPLRPARHALYVLRLSYVQNGVAWYL